MAGGLSRAGIEQLGRVFEEGAVAALPDDRLVERFLTRPGRAGEEAFAALVERHGPTVLVVCRRLLGDPNDADDAFQATFLVLARRASAIADRERLGPWLYGVAIRTARDARRRALRRRSREQPSSTLDAVPGGRSAGSDPATDELRALIGDELARLPDRYRGPVLLCDLEGLSRRDAADRLGLPEGTVSSRLARGRGLLRGRLARLGVAPALAVASTTATATAAAAPRSVPRVLVDRTARAAIDWSSSRAIAAAGPATAGAIALARGVLTTMKWQLFKQGAIGGLAALAMLGAFTAGLAARSDDGPGPGAGPRSAPAVGDEPAGRETLDGVVRDRDGQPLAGAVVVVGIEQSGRSPTRQVLRTDADGRYSCPLPDGGAGIYLAAYRAGFGPVTRLASSREAGPIDLRLPPAAPFAATLVDREGRPIAGAGVRVDLLVSEPFATPEVDGRLRSVSVVYYQVRWQHLAGTPLEAVLTATTDERGAFSFPDLRAVGGVKLSVTAADGRVLRIATADEGAASPYTDRGILPITHEDDLRVTAVPAARIVGRVVTDLPGVEVAGLGLSYQPSHPPGRPVVLTEQSGRAETDAEGRFTFDGLMPGTVNVLLRRPEDAGWTYRAAADVAVDWGETAEVTIALVEGVRVEGRVVAEGSGAPIAGAKVAHYGPDHPRSGAATTSDTTDDDGRYAFRLPPGEHYFYVMGPPDGFMRLPDQGSTQTVTIPDAETFEVPPLELAVALTVHGRVVDRSGRPVRGATIVGVCEGDRCNFPIGADPAGETDEDGRFRLAKQNHQARPGVRATLQVRLDEDRVFDVPVVPGDDGEVTAVLPAEASEGHPEADAADVPPPGTLAGAVVDEQGRPIAGVEVDVWTWFPGNETTTDDEGRFRLDGFDDDERVMVEFSKEGYGPRLFMERETGRPGWVVTMDDDTYFEGRVLDPDGGPVPDAAVRADRGPKRMDGGTASVIWTETRTDAEGRYRLRVEPDVYRVEVRAPGVGVARIEGLAIGPDEAKPLEIRLEPGIDFEARVIDAATGDPVEGLVLGTYGFDRPGIEGRSGADGVLRIDDLVPGRFDFRRVEAPSPYARWWSESAASEWNRRAIEPSGWQRNFDDLDFDLTPGMAPVTIVVEEGTTVRGRVVDPDGDPVEGATVAPAKTGSGNSITGDTRYSVTTDADGRFEVLLPASNDSVYNLIVHDGKYREWRTWANGVSEPLRTTPGQIVEDLTLGLTEPAIVRGRVVDAAGEPVAGREVRAVGTDARDNRYYVPTTETAEDGTFELGHVRPGETLVQVAPFWLDPTDAPPGTSRTVPVAPGEAVEGVELIAQPER